MVVFQFLKMRTKYTFSNILINALIVRTCLHLNEEHKMALDKWVSKKKHFFVFISFLKF